MSVKKTLGLSEKDLANARERALAGGNFPDAVRRELELLWRRQDSLPKDQTSLFAHKFMPSGWATSHLVPLLARALANVLRRSGGEASFLVADRLNRAAENVASDPKLAIELLLEPIPKGEGSRRAGKFQVATLKALDYAVLGLPVLAAVFAKSFGVEDVSISLVAEGNVSLRDCVETAVTLDLAPQGSLSEGDLLNGNSIWLPLELFSPDNVDSTTIEGISSGSL